MFPEVKALGLAFAAVMAMGALVAPTAEAIPTVATSGFSASIHGTGEGVGEKFAFEAGAVECKVSHYTGTVSDGSSTIRLTPTYTNCQAFGFLSATVTAECHYLLHLTEKKEPDWYKAHLDVECTGGGVINITASTCAMTIGSQTGLTTVDITDMTEPGTSPADITIKPTLTSEVTMDGKHGPIAYTVTTDDIGCPFSGTGAKTGGEYSTTGYITVTATSGKIEVINS